MISFDSIPLNLLTPGQFIEFNGSQALQGLAALPHKSLVLGQRLATGSVAQAVPVQITRKEQGEAFFGRGSMLSHMIQAAKAANPYTEMWAVALDDAGAGVVATGVFTPTGPATGAGTLALYIAGRSVPVAIAANDTKDQISTKIAAAINAQTDLPVTAATSGVSPNLVVTVTSRHKGEEVNYIDLRVNYYQGEQLPPGVGMAITAMSGGTTNPLVATALAAIAGSQFHTIVMAWLDATNLTALETELMNRWGPLVMKEGQAFAGATRTHANSVTLATGRNSQLLTICCPGLSPTPPYEFAAMVGGVRATAVSADPGRPYQTLLVTGALAPAEADQFDQSERNILLGDGGSTFTCVAGAVYIERLVTTYRTNAQNIPDASYRNVETIDVLAAIRYTARLRIALKYPRHKLADDGTLFAVGQAVVTPKIVRAELCALFREQETAGWVQDFEQFKTDLIVERDGTDRDRLNAIYPPTCINQFRIFAAQVQFRL